MKNTKLYSFKMFMAFVLLCGMFHSCNDTVEDVEFPEWPNISTPVIKSANLKSEAGNQNQIVAGEKVRFKAIINDAENTIRKANLKISYGDKEIKNIDFKFNSKDIEIDTAFVIPFTASLPENSHPKVEFEASNKLYKTVSITLDDENNVIVQRPVLGDKLYIVTDKKEVIELNKKSDNSYASDKKVNYFESYKIAQQIKADNSIDYTHLVWGAENGVIDIIDAADQGAIPTSLNSASIIKNITFNAMDFKSVFDLAIVFGGIELVAPSYDGYQECAIDLVNNNEYTVTGIGSLSKSINNTFFEYISEDKVRFTGMNGRYNLYYRLDKSFLYIQQNGKVYPEAVWITGDGLGFPQPPFTPDINWNWGEPHKYAYCKKVADDKFEVVVYLSKKFALKLFHQKDWGKEWQSYTFTKYPEGIIVDGAWHHDNGDFGAYTGDFINGPQFVEGVYLLKFDIANNTLEIVKQ